MARSLFEHWVGGVGEQRAGAAAVRLVHAARQVEVAVHPKLCAPGVLDLPIIHLLAARVHRAIGVRGACSNSGKNA